jgi:hypothetical protein
MDPGLVYDLSVSDYLSFICALGYNETQVSMFSMPCVKLLQTNEALPKTVEPSRLGLTNGL